MLHFIPHNDIMIPFLSLGPLSLPTYSLMALLGAAAAWIYFHQRCKARKENPGRTEQAFWFGILGALVGGKVLYLLPHLPQLAADLPLLFSLPELFYARYLSGGFVFYGGLLGALGTVWLFCRQRKIPFPMLTTDLIPAIPLFHAFGRVGCFLAGCCHGIPAQEGWLSVVFHASPAAPNEVPLVPVQLYESAACFLLFLLLDRLARRSWQGDRLLLVYLSLYAPLRFALEFFRGDAARGFLGPLSTSQILALITLAVALPLLVKKSRGQRRQ